MHKRTRIVCTIGPASQKKETLKKMMRAGMNVARLNFSHGTYANHALLVKRIRAAAREAGLVVTIIQDLQGPRIRLGEITGKVVWKKGQEVVLDGTVSKNTGRIFPVTYRRLSRDVKKGQRVLIEDGKKELMVKGVHGNGITCTVVRGGEIISHKGMNFPDSVLKIDPITEKDKKDIVFGLKQGVDYVVMSFVSHGRQIKRLRRLMGKHARSVGIIAKVEVAGALKNIAGIIREADGVMIGRGDLALEIDYADVPIWQKRIIALCRRAAKPVIVATQMMESMMKGKGALPSRSDVSDVANAVIDHADAVMTSGETAMGDNPVETVRTMAHILVEAEASPYDDVLFSTFKKTDMGVMARRYAEYHGCKAIVIEKSPIEVARLVSHARPELPIIFKSTEAFMRRLALYWGIDSALRPKAPHHSLYLVNGNIELN